MQVKKFEAPTIQEALETIKRELGPEAIILQTKKNKRGFGLMSRASVEVTAAVSDRSLQKKKLVETRLPEPNRDAVKTLPASRQVEFYDNYMEKHLERGVSATRDRVELGNRRITSARYIDIPDEPSRSPAKKSDASAKIGQVAVEEELKYLKRIIEEMKNTQEAQDGSGSGAQALLSQTKLSTPALQDLFEQLVINGVDKRFAFSLIKRASFELGPEHSKQPEQVLDQVASEIMESTAISQVLPDEKPGSGPMVLALIGPTGVGKTTTIAKIASDALIRRKLKVGLVNLDQYKVAAFDQLATYAKILNVPFRSASSVQDLRMAMQDFQSMDLVLMDTTGRSQKDPSSLQEMQDVLKTIPNIRTELVLSATTRDLELYDMASRFAVFRPEGIIVSKLDEATLFGSLLNLQQKSKLPFAYFTTGQRVPEDLEEATRERVASLILEL